MNRILLGDCLIKHEEIESESVDLILIDPPYGNMKGITNMSSMKGKLDWDNAIDPPHIFEIANRILRRNGKLVIFCQDPYTTRLISEAIPNVPFCYRMIWEKDQFANPLSAKKAPVNYFEDILIFSKNNTVYDCQLAHPLRPYFKTVFEFIGITKKELFATVGTEADHCFRFNSSQFSMCTEETYKKLIGEFHIDTMDGFQPFGQLQAVDRPHREQLSRNAAKKFPAVFNLWEGKKFKSNILKYKKDYDGHHPTQKPLLLIEDLIKTFSNEGDHVVDLTAGSGTTAVGCHNTGRRYTVIEMSLEYYQTIQRRINEIDVAFYYDDFSQNLDF